jgi:hypothetical protein
MERKPTSLAEVFSQLDARLRLARATELASLGRFLQAEALISSHIEEPKTWEEMDLLARIRVQQGRLTDAFKLWHRSLRLSPEKIASVEACLESLSAYVAAKQKRQNVILMVCLVGWVIAVAVLGGMTIYLWIK